MKFPDGTVQTTSAAGALFSVAHDATLTGNGTVGSPLGVAVPLILVGNGENLGVIQVFNRTAGGIGVQATGGIGLSGTGGTGVQARGGFFFGSGVTGGSGVQATGVKTFPGSGSPGGIGEVKEMTQRLRYNKSLAFALVLFSILFCVTTTLGQMTSFTYQGRLTDGAAPANGPYDFQFKLFDTATVGTGVQQGSTVTVDNVTVTAGIFTVQLDFGACASCFNGSARFLEIATKQTSGPTFTTLGPRQPLTSTPYAIRSLNSSTADGLSVACVNCVTSSQIQSVQGSQVTGNISGSQINGMIPIESVPFGSSHYIQNTASQQSSSNFNISGNGTVGTNLTVDGNLTVAGILNATLPAGSGNYIQNRTTTQLSSNFNIQGNGTLGGTLSVGGNIKMGDSGQFFASGGVENLYILRGRIAGNGTITTGSGFSVTRTGTGAYTVTFLRNFASEPTITATAQVTLARVVTCTSVGASSAQFRTWDSAGGAAVDQDFHFIAIGPR